MVTHSLKRTCGVNRLQNTKARGVWPAAVRFRSHVAVRVAGVAAPESQEPGAAVLADRASRTDHNGSISSDVVASTAAPSAEQHTADLERIASSGLATTSDRAGSPPSTADGRFAAGRKPGGRGSTDRNAGGRGRRTRLNPNREFDPKGFTFLLSSSSSVAELQELFAYGNERQQLNDIHMATLWSRLAKLITEESEDAQRQQQPQQPEPPAPAEAEADATASTTAPPSEPQQPQRQARTAAVARTDPAALAAFVESLEAATTPAMLQSMQARGLATVVWAAGKITFEAPQPATAATSASAVEEGARSGHQADDAAGGAGQGEEEEEDQGAARPRPLRVRGGRKAMDAAKAAAEAEAAGARGVRGHLVSRRFLESWAAAADAKLSTFNAHDISNTMWALGRLDYQPKGLFMRRLMVALLKELPRFDRPQQLSNTLLGLALLRYVPPVKDFWEPMWEAIDTLVLARSAERQPDVQAVSNSLWSLAQLSEHCPESMPVVPGDVVSKAAFRATQWADRLSPTQCQDVLTSLPHLGFEPSALQAFKLGDMAKRVAPAADGPALSNMLMALLQLRAGSDNNVRIAILKRFGTMVGETSLEAVARMLYCQGILWRHTRWLPQVWERLQRDAGQLRAVDIAFSVYGIRRLYPEILPPRMRPADAADAQPEADSDSDDDEQEVGAAGVAQDAATASSSADDGEGVLVAAEGKEVKKVEKRKPPAPSAEFLEALRGAWEALPAESKLTVVMDIRETVQEFMDNVPEHVAEQEKAAREAVEAAGAAPVKRRKRVVRTRVAAVKSVDAAEAAPVGEEGAGVAEGGEVAVAAKATAVEEGAAAAKATASDASPAAEGVVA